MGSLRRFPAILFAVIMSLSLQFAFGCTSIIPDPAPAKEPYTESADTPEPSDAAEVKTSDAAEPSGKL
ncbi:MAG: hypothetical protein IKP26_03850 [Clostridia bacterium]|nr:hypothetical protein [Clostridia bacterium]MBR6108739.1 hypothetical protein [Clostridia bacterium]